MLVSSKEPVAVNCWVPSRQALRPRRERQREDLHRVHRDRGGGGTAVERRSDRDRTGVSAVTRPPEEPFATEAIVGSDQVHVAPSGRP